MSSKSKQELMAEELDALTEMMVRESIIQDHLIAEEVENARARLAARQPEEPAQEMSKQTKRNPDFLQPKNIRAAAARSMIVPEWADEAPVVEQAQADMSSRYTETEIPHRYKVLAHAFNEPVVLVADSEQEGKAVSIGLDEYEAQVERDVAEYWESKVEEPAQVATQEEQRKVWLAGLQGGDKVLICHESGSIVGYGFVRGYRSSAKSVYVWECFEYPCGERFSRLTGRVQGGDMYIHPYSDERYEALRSYRAHPETWLTVEAPSVLDAPVQELAQVAYPLTSETMYGATPNGGTTICDTCGVPVGYDGLVPPVLCHRCSQTESTSKVEKLAENLKHLDKSGHRDLMPHPLFGSGIVFSMGLGCPSFYFRKVYQGRNKTEILDLPCAPHWLAVSRLTPAALLRWFPVALENTTYHDAIALHFSQCSQAGLRVTPALLNHTLLRYRYGGRTNSWGDVIQGNKAQANRYHALKTS